MWLKTGDQSLMKNRTAIITGGAGDIGGSIAFILADAGYKVTIIDIDAEKLEQKKKNASKNGYLIDTIESDVVNYEKAAENISFIRQYTGRPYALINCAGIIKDSTIYNMPLEDFDRVIEVNLKGTFNYIKAITPVFREYKQGKIVNITSINAFRGKLGQANYTASKAGIIGLTKTAAIELGKYNINVNAIAPGMIKTSMTEKLPDNIIQKAIDETILKRQGTPEDVAELVNFPISEKAKHITGQVIRIDGGQYL